MFPNQIKQIIKNLSINEILDCHRSGDLVYSISNKYILKVSNDIFRLEKEYIKDKWLSNYINSAKPILFIKENDKAYYLREYLIGDNLCNHKYINNPLRLIDILSAAINNLHNTKITNDKYIIDSGYNTLIHGDFCLPNILINNDKIYYIDLSESGIGDPWRDYAWCIWSLEYNLKTNKYTKLLLEKLNIEFNEEKYKQYIMED